MLTAWPGQWTGALTGPAADPVRRFARVSGAVPVDLDTPEPPISSNGSQLKAALAGAKQASPVDPAHTAVRTDIRTVGRNTPIRSNGL